MRSLPRFVLPLLYLKANIYPRRLLCWRPSPSWPSSVVIESYSGKLMPRIGSRMVSWGKELNSRRKVLLRYENGSAVLSMYEGFEWPASYSFFFPFPLRCDGRDMDFASLTKAHHALRIIIDNAQSRPSTWQIMPLLVLIVLLTSTLMLIVLTNPYQLWSPWLTLTLRWSGQLIPRLS